MRRTVMLNWFRRIALGVAILGVLILASSIAVERGFERRAQLIQRVEKTESAELFGDVGQNIGSAQLMIIDDPAAFTGAKTPEGAAIVDEGYLKSKQIYPLQLQTVKFGVEMARIGSLVAIGVGLVAAWWATRRRSKAADRFERTTGA